MALIVTEKIGIMFLILLLGILCYKKKILNEQTNVKLSNFLLQVVNPIVIFVSYQMTYELTLLKNLLLSFLLASASFIIMILIGNLLIGKKSGKNYSLERLSAVYPNCGFIGIPLINALFGKEGVFYLTGYLTVFYLFLWTHGVILMVGKTTRKELVKNLVSPAIIGVILGLCCFLLQILFPRVIVEALESVGSMNTPLAMVIAGVTLGQADIKKSLKNIRIYYISFIKLIIMPLSVVLLLCFLPLSPVLAFTIVIASACPVGACCTMFALRYGKDGVYASQLFAATTLFSAVTVPLIILISGIAGIA